jgi:glycerol-3-phosphate O-acyltransferase/dihydroxyacetone phosphate acyltransferase
MFDIQSAAARFVLKGAMWALDRFYDLGRLGPDIPAGPVLLIANHPNSVMDALVVMKAAGRRVRPLAKAPLFEQALIGQALRGLGALPVYRPQDFPGETWRNERTFAAAVEALRRGEAVLIFPEGLSHSESSLAKLKTGAARIALETEDASDWRLGLRVVPVGLTYDRKHAFQGRVAVAVGQPLRVSDWRRRRGTDPWTAVESLTAAMRGALEWVTLNLPTREDRILLEAAESLYATEKRLAGPRERVRLAPRLGRLQTFARALAWLHICEPERYAQLGAAVMAYRQQLGLLGVRQGELPERFPALGVLRYVLSHGVLLLIGLPLALLGTLVWYLPYKSPRASLGLYRPPYEAVASLKLATALLAFPLTYALYLALAWWLGGLAWSIVAAVLLPPLGLIALAWRDRWKVVREDASVFWHSVRRSTLRRDLLARRQALVSEFDSLERRWRAEGLGQP